MKPITVAELEAELLVALAREDIDLADAIGADIDRRTTRPSPVVGPLAAALWYADQGLWVFPLARGSKKPHRGTGGLDEATNDPASVVGLFGEHPPDSNVAIATGHLVDVVDIDGPVGVKSLATHLLDEDGSFAGPPVLGTVSTPRPGGKHLYIPVEQGHGNRTHMLPGIDYRGLGGYVVAPTSRISQGEHPGAYAWVRPLDLSGVR